MSFVESKENKEIIQSILLEFLDESNAEENYNFLRLSVKIN